MNFRTIKQNLDDLRVRIIRVDFASKIVIDKILDRFTQDILSCRIVYNAHKNGYREYFIA